MRRIALSGLALAAALSAATLAPASAAPDAGPAVGAAERPTAPAWKVKAKTGKAPVVVDEDEVVVRGKVARAAAGQKVVLQQRLEKQMGWKATGTFRIKKNGSFKATDEPSTGGVRLYRVVKKASDGRAKGVSRELEVTVLRWQSLGNFVSNSSGAFIGPVTIGTKEYPNSLVQTTAGKPGYAEFTVGRLCTEMRGAFSLSDSSQTGSSGRVVLTADGTVVADQPLAVGTFTPVTGEIDGLFRLRADLSSTGDATAVPPVPQGNAVFATPEVLCAT